MPTHANLIFASLLLSIALTSGAAMADTTKPTSPTPPAVTEATIDNSADKKVTKPSAKPDSKADDKVEKIEVKSTNAYDARREDTAT